jgi:hypothetical protein
MKSEIGRVVDRRLVYFYSDVFYFIPWSMPVASVYLKGTSQRRPVVLTLRHGIEISCLLASVIWADEVPIVVLSSVLPAEVWIDVDME